MTSPESGHWGKRIVEAGWLTLAAGVPIGFAPWGRNSFELPKAVLLWVVVAGMGAAWLAGRRRQPVDPGHPHGLALAFSLTLILATCFSINPLLSAQGYYDRMQGTITWLCYLALFMLAADGLRDLTQVCRLLAALAWGSAPVVAYGLLQVAGLDPLNWRVEGSPAISTLGRSNFLGAYLVLVLPPTLVCAWQVRGRARRAAHVTLLGAQLLCLLATMTRAAWLGAAAAGGVLVLAAAWSRGRRRLAVGGLAVGALGLVVGLAALMLVPTPAGSTGARVTIWRATWPLIAARPILGYGPETFSQVFTAVFPPGLVYLQGRAVLVDRAHNLILDTLVSTGLAGFLAYAALVGTVAAAGARAFTQTTDRQVRVVLAAGLAAVAGHLVETQFSFPVTSTATLFWLMLGMLAAPWKRSPLPVFTEVSPLAGWPRKALAALLLLAMVPASLTVLIADAYAGDANRTQTLADISHSIVAARQAAALWPGQPAYSMHLSWLYLQQARRGGNERAGFEAAESALDAARRLTPGDYQVWAGYGELYAEWGQASDPARFAQAEAAYRQAVALFPGSAMLHTGWGMVYMVQGRWAEATAQFNQTVSLDNTDAWGYWRLGDALLAQADLVGAERAYRNALRWAPNMAEAYRGLGHVYRRQDLVGVALLTYQSALALTPDDPGLVLDVARCYWDSGQFDLACQMVERGLQIAPDHRELLAFRAECIR